MARLQRKRFSEPVDVRRFPNGRVDVIELDDAVVGRMTYEPGWRWSVDVKPIAGTDACRYHHVGVTLEGRLRVQMPDGTELEIGPGDVFEIPPGHDAWVLGDTPWVSVDWEAMRTYGRGTGQPGGRVLGSILITDIVDSTAGDGVLALFDSTEGAIRAAVGIREAVQQLELQVRAGIHAGEVELLPDDVRGFAVHVAARIQDLAAPGEILVSGTSRDLLEGSDLTFEDRGSHELKGISGGRQVFALT